MTGYTGRGAIVFGHWQQMITNDVDGVSNVNINISTSTLKLMKITVGSKCSIYDCVKRYTNLILIMTS